MKTQVYLILARMNDDSQGDPVFAIASSKKGAQIAMMEILRKDAIAAHEGDTPSEDAIEDFIQCEYTIDEPIELPLHGDTGAVARYLIKLGRTQ